MSSEMTILLADSDQEFLAFFGECLKNTGINLLTCQSGKDTLAIIKENKPDLIFMHYSQGDMAAVDCCRKIRVKHSIDSLPIIILLPANNLENSDRFLQAGFNDLLSKPIKRNTLLVTINKFLNLEKRRTKRVKPQSNIKCALEYSTHLNCRVFDISTGGLFLASCPPLPVNTIISLNFTLPDTTIDVSCKARVAWINHPIAMSKMNFPSGLGVQFVEINPETVNTISEYLKAKQSD
jgi:CheY-like chemotaxis protein